MRARDRQIAAVMALAAWAMAGCASNPDPRRRPAIEMMRDGHGGWITVKLASGTDADTGELINSGEQVSGELIAVDASNVVIMAIVGRQQLLVVPKAAVVVADVWAWEAEHGGLGVWGAAGSLSTISHGWFLLFTLPMWVLSATATAAAASRTPLFSYPADGWEKLAIWARFPQGAPVGLTLRDLTLQDRRPRRTGPPGAEEPAPTTPAGPVVPTTPAAPPLPPAAGSASSP